ncbi:hypothetical protein [Coxiella burnetii]|uniref:hypothetical protein n=1 Tax=Coxiella burnetii TaxID=777 RepID=UPI000CDEFC44|nr:hypothetical protein [Coxiella burnetii]
MRYKPLQAGKKDYCVDENALYYMKKQRFPKTSLNYLKRIPGPSLTKKLGNPI